MKIPNEVVGRTQPSGQPLAPLQDSSALAVRGWQQAFDATERLGGVIQQRRDQSDRFDAMTGMAEFEKRYATTQAEIDRTTDVNDKSYLERSELTFDNYSRDFLSKLPPSIRPEFEARIAEMKTGAFKRAQSFKYGMDDIRYREGIDKVFQKAKIDLDANYSDEALKSNLATIYESIDASNLLPDDKEKLKLDTAEALAAVGYRKSLSKTGTVPAGTYGDGKKMQVEGNFGKQLAFVVHELNGTEGKAGAALKQATTIRDAVAAGIAYERPANTPGALAWDNRINNAKKVLNGKAPPRAMQAYSYLMSQGYTQVQAAGFVGSLMQESGQNLNPDSINRNDAGPGRHSIGIGQWNNERLAALKVFGGAGVTEVDAPKIGGYVDSGVDNNPLFDALPLEKRIAIRDSWEVDQRQADAAAAKAEKDKYDSWFNQTKIDVYNGRKSLSDLEDSLNKGEFKDYNDFAAAKTIFDQRKEKVTKLDEAKSALSSGIPLTGSQADALYENDKGAERLWKMDGDYAAQITQQRGAVGPLAQGTLSAMLLGNDENRALFAMQTLRQLKQSGDATQYNQLPDNAQKMVDQFYTLSGSRNDMELLRALRGGENADPVVRQQMEQFRVNADKVYDTESFGPKAADSALKSWLSPWLADNAQLANLPYVRPAFNDWYREEWKLNYAKFLGDASAATKATDVSIESKWGVTDVGNRTFMMTPPEKLGLPSYMTPGDFKEQALSQLAASGWKDVKSFQLIDDRQTQDEVAAWRANGMKQEASWRNVMLNAANKVFSMHIPTEPQVPSYKVIIQQADGTYRAVQTRVRFYETPEARKREEDLMDVAAIDGKIDGLTEMLMETRIRQHEISGGASQNNTLTKSLEDQIKELEQQREVAAKKIPFKRLKPFNNPRGAGARIVEPKIIIGPESNPPKRYPANRLEQLKLSPEQLAIERKNHPSESDYEIRLRIYRDWIAPGGMK